MFKTLISHFLLTVFTCHLFRKSTSLLLQIICQQSTQNVLPSSKVKPSLV